VPRGSLGNGVGLGAARSGSSCTDRVAFKANELPAPRNKCYARLGLDPASFSGHSLRSGYVTSAVEANAPILRIVEQTRHKSLDMVRTYSRRADLFRDHSGASFT
jgi:hypothetical protein